MKRIAAILGILVGCWLLGIVYLEVRAPGGMSPSNVARVLARSTSNKPVSEGCDAAADAFIARLQREETRRLSAQARALPQIAQVSRLQPPDAQAVRVWADASGVTVQLDVRAVTVEDTRFALSDLTAIREAAQRARNYREQQSDPVRPLLLQISAAMKLSAAVPVLDALLQTGEVEFALREAKSEALSPLPNAPDWYRALAAKLAAAPIAQHKKLISAELSRLTKDSKSATLALRVMPSADEASTWRIARRAFVTSGDLKSPSFSFEHAGLCELEASAAYQALIVGLLDTLRGPAVGVVSMRADATPVSIACELPAQAGLQSLADAVSNGQVMVRPTCDKLAAIPRAPSATPTPQLRDTPSATPNPFTQTIVSPNALVTVHYPPSFSAKTNGQTVVMLTRKLPSDHVELASFVALDAPSSDDLREFARIVEKTHSTLPDYTQLTQVTTTCHGVPCIRVVNTWRSETVFNRHVGEIFIKDGHGFSFTYLFPQDEGAGDEPLLAKIVESAELNP